MAPFVELEHTADMAFSLRGYSMAQLFSHAQLALAFYFPQLVTFIEKKEDFNSLDRIVMELNEWLSRVDGEIGIPFKAVSFHGKMQSHRDFLEWEMIVDV
jgi:hypothetical protein